MKFTCEKYLLSLAVSTAGRAAASKSPIPALAGLLVEANANVRITGYDLKKGIYTSFDADVSVPGSVVLSAKLFGDIVRKLPDGIVTVSSDEYNAVNIKCGNADYNISGNSAEDYPELPSMDYASAITLPQDVFSRMISETSFAISTNESRPVYTGALFPLMSNPSSTPSTATTFIVPSVRLAPLKRRYQVIGSSSAQSNASTLASVARAAALLPARSPSGVRVVTPVVLTR